jgi:hypothetical protein
MTDVATSELKRAIESQHGGTATWIESVDVCDRFQGKTVWQGEVQVFALTGHPSALRCYAWSSPIEGSAKRRFFAVLHHTPPLPAKIIAKVASMLPPRTMNGWRRTEG